MSALALIFCSDGFALSRLREAFKRLGLEVELGREVFYCLEALTSRRFDVIAIDWNEGPEALFLLKTARDLKHNRGAFCLILANPDDFLDAQSAGANLVFRNSASPEEMANSLVACKEFQIRLKVSGQKVSTPKIDLTKIYEDRPKSAAGTKTDQKPTIFAEETLPVEPLAMVSDRRSSIFLPGVLDSYLADDRPRVRSMEDELSAVGQNKLTFPEQNPNGSAFLRIGALVFAFLSFGYSISQPLLANVVFTAATKTCTHTLQKAQTFFLKTTSAKPSDDGESAVNSDQGLSQHLKSTNPTMTPRIAVDSLGGSRSASSEATTSVEVRSNGDRAVSVQKGAGPEVPDSLKVPMRIETSTAPVVARPGSLLAHGLGTISLPPEVSQKMLLDRLPPAYPQQALQQRLEGSVVVQALIGTDGNIQSLKLIRGSLILGAAACKAIKQWRYRPYLLNGQAVEAQTYVTVDFKLPEEVVKAEIRN